MKLFDKFFPPHVVTFVSDRSVDFRLPDAAPALGREQEKFLAECLGFPLSKVFTIRQVHGDRIVIATNEGGTGNGTWEEADGVLTDKPELPIAVRTADCLSVFFYDSRHEVIGLVHAGWRGTRKKILVQTLERMRRQWDSDPKDLRAAFAPAIRSCCYQVGPEFQGYFPDEVVRRNEGYFLDLRQANINQLARCGIDHRQIFDSDVCTCCNDAYFSYRREGESAGRMISLMMLKGEGV